MRRFRKSHWRWPMADILATGLLWAMALLVSAALVWMLADIFRLGVGVIDAGFLLEAPRDAGRAGGIFPMILSTLWILTVCLAVVVPLGLATAVALSEYMGGCPARIGWPLRPWGSLTPVIWCAYSFPRQRRALPPGLS